LTNSSSISIKSGIESEEEEEDEEKAEEEDETV
jgi:hypothetical protein